MVSSCLIWGEGYLAGLERGFNHTEAILREVREGRGPAEGGGGGPAASDQVGGGPGGTGRVTIRGERAPASVRLGLLVRAQPTSGPQIARETQKSAPSSVLVYVCVEHGVGATYASIGAGIYTAQSKTRQRIAGTDWIAGTE
eukprot:2221496-Rhodomonas_salina.4